MSGRIGKMTALLLAAAAMFGCLLPDNYTAKITLKKGFAYDIAFDGDVTVVPPGRRRNDPVPQGDSDKLTAEIKEIPGMKSVTHIKNLDYRVTYARSGILSDGQKIELFSANAAVLRLQRQGSQVIVESPPINDTDQQALLAAGYTSRGKVSISADVDADASFKHEGGTPTTSLFGLVTGKAVEWDLDLLGSARRVFASLEFKPDVSVDANAARSNVHAAAERRTICTKLR
jgi:hypothetical protein